MSAAIEDTLSEMLGCDPSEVVDRVGALVERSNRRGAVAGDTLVAIGMMHANARNLARFVLAGDEERARELALHLRGEAEQVATEVTKASGYIGLRGWWTAGLAESMADVLRTHAHEAGFQVSMTVNSSEGPLTFTVRRGAIADHATAIEQRNTELVTRNAAMAELLDTLCGLLVVSDEGAADVDFDEIDRRLALACDQWTSLRAEMVRARGASTLSAASARDDLPSAPVVPADAQVNASATITLAAAGLLGQVIGVSQLNRADMPTDRPTGEPAPPWRVALHWLAAGSQTIAPPAYEGDRPADLTDAEIADAATWEPEYRNRCRTPDGRALVWREAIYDRGRADGTAATVRETHPTVHRALKGATAISGCRWCEEQRR